MRFFDSSTRSLRSMRVRPSRPASSRSRRLRHVCDAATSSRRAGSAPSGATKASGDGTPTETAQRTKASRQRWNGSAGPEAGHGLHQLRRASSGSMARSSGDKRRCGRRTQSEVGPSPAQVPPDEREVVVVHDHRRPARGLLRDRLGEGFVERAVTSPGLAATPGRSGGGGHGRKARGRGTRGCRWRSRRRPSDRFGATATVRSFKEGCPVATAPAEAWTLSASVRAEATQSAPFPAVTGSSARAPERLGAMPPAAAHLDLATWPVDERERSPVRDHDEVKPLTRAAPRAVEGYFEHVTSLGGELSRGRLRWARTPRSTWASESVP